MKKLGMVLAFFAFLAAVAGAVYAAIRYLEEKRGMFCDDDYEDDLFEQGQEYYAEDMDEDEILHQSDCNCGDACGCGDACSCGDACDCGGDAAAPEASEEPKE